MKSRLWLGGRLVTLIAQAQEIEFFALRLGAYTDELVILSCNAFRLFTVDSQTIHWLLSLILGIVLQEWLLPDLMSTGNKACGPLYKWGWCYMNSLGKKVKAESNECVERDWIMVKEGRQKNQRNFQHRKTVKPKPTSYAKQKGLLNIVRSITKELVIHMCINTTIKVCDNRSSHCNFHYFSQIESWLLMSCYTNKCGKQEDPWIQSQTYLEILLQRTDSRVNTDNSGSRSLREDI